MSASTLTRPTPVLRDRTVPVSVRSSTGVGSYVDTDGVRRAPVRTGSYTGTATTVTVGSYTGRRPQAVGSYVRSER